MRPRKKILLYCENMVASSVYRFVIQTHHFEVFTIRSIHALRGASDSSNLHDAFCAAFVIRGSKKDFSLEASFVIDRTGLRTVFMNEDKRNAMDAIPPSHVFFDAPVSPCEWIERLKVLAIRKRGPKKMNSARATRFSKESRISA